MYNISWSKRIDFIERMYLLRSTFVRDKHAKRKKYVARLKLSCKKVAKYVNRKVNRGLLLCVQLRMSLAQWTAVPINIAFKAKYAGIVKFPILLSLMVCPIAERYRLAYIRRRTAHISDNTAPTVPLTRIEKESAPTRNPGSCSTWFVWARSAKPLREGCESRVRTVWLRSHTFVWRRPLPWHRIESRMSKRGKWW